MTKAFPQTVVRMSLLQWQKYFPRRLLQCLCYNDKSISADDIPCLLQWQKNPQTTSHVFATMTKAPRRLLECPCYNDKSIPRRFLECPCYNDKGISPDDCHNVSATMTNAFPQTTVTMSLSFHHGDCNNRLGKYFCHCNKKIEQSSGEMFLLPDCSKKIMTVVWGNAFTGSL